MTEDEQHEMVSEFVEDAILPMFSAAESIFAKIDPEFAGCPYYDTFVTLARILVCKGWTAEELIRDVKHHTEEQEKYNQIDSPTKEQLQ